MRLRVLGSSSSVPRPGRACSGYLLQTPGAAIAIELGNGAFANLRTAIDYTRLDAVVVTHMHADHFLDVIPLRYALTYGSSRRQTRLPLWLPPGGTPTLRTVASAFDAAGRGDFLDAVFAVAEYDPERTLALGDLQLRFAPADHYVDAFAVRAEHDSEVLVYSGDTAPCRNVVDLARHASAFVCEATLGLGGEEAPRGHCSAAEAGEMARDAGVGRLALTHYGSDCDPHDIVAAARRAFDGPVVAVDDGDDVAVEKRG